MKTLRRAAASALIVALPCEAQALSCGARTCWRGWNQERNPNGPRHPVLSALLPTGRMQSRDAARDIAEYCSPTLAVLLVRFAWSEAMRRAYFRP